MFTYPGRRDSTVVRPLRGLERVSGGRETVGTGSEIPQPYRPADSTKRVVLFQFS